MAGLELTACFLSAGIKAVSLCLPMAHLLAVTGSHCAIQSDLELAILPPQLPECWAIGCTSQLAETFIKVVTRRICSKLVLYDFC